MRGLRRQPDPWRQPSGREEVALFLFWERDLAGLGDVSPARPAAPEAGPPGRQVVTPPRVILWWTLTVLLCASICAGACTGWS